MMNRLFDYVAKLSAMPKMMIGMAFAMMTMMPAFATEHTITDDQFTKISNINLIKSLYMTSLDKNNPEYYDIWRIYITPDFSKVLHDDVMAFSDVDFSCRGANPLLIEREFVQSVDEVNFEAPSDNLVIATMAVPMDYALYKQYDQAKISFALMTDEYDHYPRIDEIYHEFLKNGENVDGFYAEKLAVRRCVAEHLSAPKE